MQRRCSPHLQEYLKRRRRRCTTHRRDSRHRMPCWCSPHKRHLTPCCARGGCTDQAPPVPAVLLVGIPPVRVARAPYAVPGRKQQAHATPVQPPAVGVHQAPVTPTYPEKMATASACRAAAASTRGTGAPCEARRDAATTHRRPSASSAAHGGGNSECRRQRTSWQCVLQ